MRFSTAFREIAASRKVSYARLGMAVAATTGRAVSAAAVASMVRKGNPSLDALRPYLSAMGYEVALVPAGTEALLPEGSYVIDEGADRG